MKQAASRVTVSVNAIDNRINHLSSAKYINRRRNMKLKQLSAAEFDRLIATKNRFKDNARQILRAVLVEGRSQADVAVDFGVTKQRVNRLMSFFKKNYMAQAGSGSALVSVAIDLPENLAIDLTAMMDAMKACEDDALGEEAIEKVRAAVRRASKQLAVKATVDDPAPREVDSSTQRGRR